MFGPQMCVLYNVHVIVQTKIQRTNHHQTSFLNAQPTKLRSKTVGTKSNPQTERNGGQPCSVCVYNIVYYSIQIVCCIYITVSCIEFQFCGVSCTLHATMFSIPQESKPPSLTHVVHCTVRQNRVYICTYSYTIYSA